MNCGYKMSEVKPGSHFMDQVPRFSYEVADPFASLNRLPRISPVL